MKEAGPIKSVGSVRLTPLKGRQFDIQPPESGLTPSGSYKMSDYGRFALVGFVAFVILNIGNAYVKGKDMIYESSQLAHAGFEQLKTGMDSLLEVDTEGASKAFTEAEYTFEQLKAGAQVITTQANDFIDQDLYLDSANALLNIAVDVSIIGQKLAGLVDRFLELPYTLFEAKTNWMPMVEERYSELSALITDTAQLQRNLAGVNLKALPQSLQRNVLSAREQVGQFLAALLEADAVMNDLRTLLGDKVPHRYLILFQNNNEIRATGGFIGSYMIVELDDGEITKMEAKDVYDSDGQLMEFLPAPPGIDQLTDRLYMRDANYSPDFPTSARQIMWLLEASRAPSADTVIAIDQSLVESVLELTGPLSVPEFPYPLTAENFTRTVSYHAEAQLTDTHTPKQFLFDLIPLFKEKLMNLTDLDTVLPLAERMVREGRIQIYSADSFIQKRVEQLGLDGSVTRAEAKTDYLSVIRTSISGNKSDSLVEVDLSHHTLVERGGGVVDELVIKKTHPWGKQQERDMANLVEWFGTGKRTKLDLYHIMGRSANKDYTRVYVPLGSQLESVEGIRIELVDISEDLGYTVFGFVHSTELGRSSQIRLRYRLPFQLHFKPLDHYRLMAERQAGEKKLSIRKTFSLADGLAVQEVHPEKPIDQPFDDTVTFVGAVSE